MNGMNLSLENGAEIQHASSSEQLANTKQIPSQHHHNDNAIQLENESSEVAGPTTELLMNGTATTTTAADTMDEEQTTTAAAMGGCTMCDDDEANTLDLSQNVEMRQTLHNYWQIPAHCISQTLASLCVQCIYKINAHKEMTRNLQLRLHRLTKGEVKAGGPLSNALKAPPPLILCHTNVQSASATTTTASNGHHSPPQTTVPSPRKEQCTSTTIAATSTTSLNSPPLSGDAAGDEAATSLTITTTSTTATSPPSQHQQAPQQQRHHHHHHGAVHETCKKSPDSTITESAETELSQSRWLTKRLRRVSCHSTTSESTSPSQRNQSMLRVFREQPESARITESGGKINQYTRRERMQQLVCKHCTRVYLRKYYYSRHVRRCGARHRWRAASAVSAGAEGEGGDDGGRTSDGELASSPLRQFHCPTCPVTVRSMAKLKEHRRIHLKRYFCATCGNESTAFHDFEFHQVICDAKRMAQLSMELQNGATVLDEPASPSGSTVWLNPNNSLVTGRMTRSRSLALTRVGAASSLWSQQRYDPDSGEDDEGDDDDEDDDENAADDEEVSVADTMYSKRMSFTGNWLNDLDSTCVSLYNESLLDFDDESQIITHKEYDLYLLSRLKAEILAGSLTCFEPTCDYNCDTLLYMMIHDYMEHFKRSWFYCRKCTRVFTSKVFLDYHLERQNTGRFICFKCGEIFEFQHMLDRHLIRHMRSTNYRCNYCNFEFLTEHELLQHCAAEQHDPNGERELIRIVPEMTIINETPRSEADAAGGASEKRCFRVHEKTMHLPAMPSLRPMSLPNHQPYRRQIGDIEFKNKKNPNCWGWK